jgi:hypothetical protein
MLRELSQSFPSKEFFFAEAGAVLNLLAFVHRSMNSVAMWLDQHTVESYAPPGVIPVLVGEQADMLTSLCLSSKIIFTYSPRVCTVWCTFPHILDFYLKKISIGDIPGLPSPLRPPSIKSYTSTLLTKLIRNKGTLEKIT